MQTGKQLFLLIVFGILCLAMFHGSVQAAGNDEVTERLELNTATVDQITALGVVTKEEATKIVKYRDEVGDLKSYEDLGEAGIPKEKIDLLRPKTTVDHMATDCSC